MTPMDSIQVVADDPNLLPVRAHEGDAGADLRAAQDYLLQKGEQVKIRAGVKMLIPYGYAGLVRGRSGLAMDGFIVTEGTIDCQYRGEISIIARSLFGDWQVKKYDRVAQVLIIPVALPCFLAVDSLPESVRGCRGFGSTGVRGVRR